MWCIVISSQGILLSVADSGLRLTGQAETLYTHRLVWALPTIPMGFEADVFMGQVRSSSKALKVNISLSLCFISIHENLAMGELYECSDAVCGSLARFCLISPFTETVRR